MIQPPAPSGFRWGIFLAVLIPAALGLAILGGVSFLIYCVASGVGLRGQRTLPPAVTPLGSGLQWMLSHPIGLASSAKDPMPAILLGGIGNWLVWSVLIALLLAIIVMAVLWAVRLLARDTRQ